MNLDKIIELLINENATKSLIAQTFIWYHFKNNNEGLTIAEINNYFKINNLTKYNSTYLKEDLKKSKNITRESKSQKYTPLYAFITQMNIKFQDLNSKTEEISTDETIIPLSLVTSTRGYILNLSNQINASYHYNIFDGCAILMRRLLEILLIHCYEACNKDDDIKENGGFKKLNTIINQVILDKPFNLSKDVQEVLHVFRELGNFSAHRIQYNAKRADINNVKLKYRVTIEELLYTTKFKK